MAKVGVGMPMYSTLRPLLEVPAYERFVATEKYFKEAGVIGMSHTFETLYIGLEVGAKGPSVVALRQLNWEVSDLAWERKLGHKAEVSIPEFVTALTAYRGSKERISGHIRGIGGNHHLCVVVATYMSGFLSGWTVDVSSIMDKCHRPVGSKFVTQH